MRGKVKVLVVDGSEAVRTALAAIVGEHPGLEVLGLAADPYDAAEIIAREVPDVILMDVALPRMDGLTFLRKIMEQYPIPAVVCPSGAAAGQDAAMAALEAGALDIVPRPPADAAAFPAEARARLCEALKAAAGAALRNPGRPAGYRLSPRPLHGHGPAARPARGHGPGPQADAAARGRHDDKHHLYAAKLTADVILPPPRRRRVEGAALVTDSVVCIGASTGGTESLRVLIESLPATVPGTVIVQHMPEHFTDAFARRLDSLAAVTVREARNGDPILRGQVLIAPGNRHLLIRRTGPRYHVEVRDGPLVCRHRPSVDVLFRSAAHYAGANAVGVLMTGMGDDGARGLLEMRQAGAHTIAEDESSCVVFGMPREAIKLGAARAVVPLARLKDEILGNCVLRGTP